VGNEVVCVCVGVVGQEGGRGFVTSASLVTEADRRAASTGNGVGFVGGGGGHVPGSGGAWRGHDGERNQLCIYRVGIGGQLSRKPPLDRIATSDTERIPTEKVEECYRPIMQTN
jgi:hypothetical protein